MWILQYALHLWEKELTLWDSSTWYLFKIQVYIVKGASKLLLGVPGIRKLGLIHDLPCTYSIKAFNVAELSPPMSKQSMVNEYPKLFSGLGKLQGEHKIQLKENATPSCLATPRRVPLPLMKKVKDEIDRMVDCGVIELVNANSGFHQIMLSDESAKLTTFVTPYGGYMFRRLPFGISSAPEYFPKRMDRELSGLDGDCCRTRPTRT